MKRQITSTILAHPAFVELDRHFALLMERMAGGDAPALALAAALVSERVRGGHSCFEFADAAKHSVFQAGEGGNALWLPDLGEWMTELRAAPVVGGAGEMRPLVLDSAGRLYLHRYWECERDVARGVRDRCGAALVMRDEKLLTEGLSKYFPSSRPDATDWQKIAVLAALRNRFTVLSGGPGTGKTHTVGVLLALLLEQWPDARVALGAPTGKAAARLQECINGLKRSLGLPPGLATRLPTEAKTVHRLLGIAPDGAEPRFNEKNPLPFDTVILDEASMLDLSVMAKLFRALPDHARLVLVGDKDQLASVEAGAVLGDLGSAAAVNGFSVEFRKFCERLAGEKLPGSANEGAMVDAVVQLVRNFRFGATGELAELSAAVNEGDQEKVIGISRRSRGEPPASVSSPAGRTQAGRGNVAQEEGARPAKRKRGGEHQAELQLGAPSHFAQSDAVIFREPPSPGELKAVLRERVLAKFLPMFRETDPPKALAELGQFRILCAVREGPFGVANLNRLVEQILAEAGVIQPGIPWYAGRPVMVTRNDYSLRLFNGDLGVVLREADGQLRACFASAEGGVKKIPPVRLPDHETVFAMTVHKSQGSEFDELLMILPDATSPVLSRELLYTGLTRARRGVEVWGSELALAAAVGAPLVRKSGLREALRG